MVQQAHVGAQRIGGDVADDDVVDGIVHARYFLDGRVVQAGEGNGIVLRVARDVLQEEIAASEAQIDAILVGAMPAGLEVQVGYASV